LTDLVVRGRHFQEDAILDTLRACAVRFRWETSWISCDFRFPASRGPFSFVFAELSLANTKEKGPLLAGKIFADVVCLVSSRIEQRIQVSVAGMSLEIYFESN